LADIFHEVDEEVRRERLQKLWDRYSIYIIGLAVLIVAGMAAWRGYEWWVAKQAAAAGAQFEQALTLSEQGKHAEAGVKALIEGVELTERELQKALEKNGVRQFTPRGEKFDPNVHQAMFEVPDPAVPAGSVVEVVQPGYMIGERVLRPALVGVSKGGPKTAPAHAAVNDNATAAKDS